jgi:DNA-binding transcriptional LysR family regulator
MYAGGVREAFDMIDAATMPLQAGDSREMLTASVLPPFAAKWLVPGWAAAGQDVVLARGELAAGDLAEGRLVRLFALSLPAWFAYYVVCPKAYAERPKIRAFCEWLLAETGAPTKDE